MNITIEQTKELHLLVAASKNEILEGVHGVARVAKKIQIYLGCEFKEAVRILSILIEA